MRLRSSEMSTSVYYSRSALDEPVDLVRQSENVEAEEPEHPPWAGVYTARHPYARRMSEVFLALTNSLRGTSNLP